MNRIAIGLLAFGLFAANGAIAEEGFWDKLGKMFQKGGEAAERGVEKGGKAVVKSVEKGGKATSNGLDKAGDWLDKKFKKNGKKSDKAEE